MCERSLSAKLFESLLIFIILQPKDDEELFKSIQKGLSETGE